MSAFSGELNRSAQHFILYEKMECSDEAKKARLATTSDTKERAEVVRATHAGMSTADAVFI